VTCCAFEVGFSTRRHLKKLELKKEDLLTVKRAVVVCVVLCEQMSDSFYR